MRLIKGDYNTCGEFKIYIKSICTNLYSNACRYFLFAICCMSKVMNAHCVCNSIHQKIVLTLAKINWNFYISAASF